LEISFAQKFGKIAIMKNTKNEPIKADMLIADLAEKYPKAATVLMTDYGFHCVGCLAATQETLAQGAAAHGMEEEDIERMIKALNRKLRAE